MKKKKTYAKKHLYLLEIYTCYARFYEMTVSGKYNCRDVLDIIRKEPVVQPDPQKLLAKKMDAIFIMMNPGSSEPKNKNNNGRKMTEAEPDDTQFQLMRVMDKKNWQHVRVLNLSDLRATPCKEFYKKLREVAEIPSGEEHSIFTTSRRKNLEKIWMLKDNAPVVAAWGVADDLDALIAQCMNYLNRKNVKPIGWLKSKTNDRFYHPWPRNEKAQQDWINNILELLP